MVSSTSRQRTPELNNLVEARRRLLRSPPSASSTASTRLSARSPPCLQTPLTAGLAHAASLAPEDASEGHCLVELNESLNALILTFPNILPEVFREMLSRFSGDSRLHVVMDQLLRHGDNWVHGRWRIDSDGNCSGSDITKGREALLPIEDQFRRESYKRATRTALSQEFKVLSKSTINAVMAEHNYSYTFSRPVLQQIAAKSWRNSISIFLSRLKNCVGDAQERHYLITWTKPQTAVGVALPYLRNTGDVELDEELCRTILRPLLETSKQVREAEDWNLALEVNEKEAANAEALHLCECCFSDTTFEQMATCTAAGHVLCFRCVRHAISEALFGQSWGLNIDHKRGQLKCLAPTTEDSCVGCIPHHLVRSAVKQAKGGAETWRMLEARFADEALSITRVPLIRCPFCLYAEIDDVYFPPHTLRWSLNVQNPIATVMFLLITVNFLPLLSLYALLCNTSYFHDMPAVCDVVSRSIARLARSSHLPNRFECRSPVCALPSCLICQKRWLDPHTCHESAALSLRITIEAARTAALKRTCPRCGLGFIKDSGCNKLTCVCGYIMCYVCRQGLAREEGGEGYRHFCQHFRPIGGKCEKCEKCDLYIGEEEEGLVRRAGENAEKEWREKEGMTDVRGIGGQTEMQKNRWRQGDLTMQGLLDWWIHNLICC